MNANALDSLDFDQLVPKDSKFLTKGDCGEDGLILTIAGFTSEDMKTDDGGYETKVVMHFTNEGIKPMILNRTNSQLLAQATGVRKAGEARGKKIVVYHDPSVGFGGRVVGGLRIKRIPGPARAPAAPPARAQAAKPAPAAREPGSDDEPPFNDDVPNF